MNEDSDEEFNTWDDWRLIPTSRPVVAPPSQKTNYVDIPGANGSLDLSTALTGIPVFENRSGSFEFALPDADKDWAGMYSYIANFLHGRRLKMVLEDDPAYYYVGRFSISDWTSDENYTSVSIDYELEPLKNDIYNNADEWLWNPFDFINQVTRDIENINITSTNKTITINDPTSYPSIPTIVVNSMTSSTMTVAFDGEFYSGTYDLNVGENIIPQIIIYKKVLKKTTTNYNVLTFTGTGNVSVKYKGRSL